MNLKLETTDEEFYLDFIIKYVKENKKQTYKLKTWEKKEKNGQIWHCIELDNVYIKLK